MNLAKQECIEFLKGLTTKGSFEQIVAGKKGVFR